MAKESNLALVFRNWLIILAGVGTDGDKTTGGGWHTGPWNPDDHNSRTIVPASALPLGLAFLNVPSCLRKSHFPQNL